MIGMYAIIAAGLIAAGVALGIVAVTSMAVRDEIKAGQRLAVGSPRRRASGVRRLTGLNVRRPEVTS
jgi:hypothetical protein